ncbi:hypothetical protein INR49_001660 [Caranx melampygus]|nr:hypothetical protein INR49_001660 [Caranx melampygus]
MSINTQNGGLQQRQAIHGDILSELQSHHPVLLQPAKEVCLGGTTTAQSQTPPSAPSPTPVGTGVIGRVGDLPPPPPSLCDDFPPPPPPPPLDDDLPAPPPECHSTPSASDAPPPAFPAPPPVADDLPLPAPPEDSACPTSCPSPPSPPPPPTSPPNRYQYFQCCWEPTETGGEADKL